MSEEDDKMSLVYDGKKKDSLTPMADIRKIAQQAMKDQGLTFEEVKKTLGIKRYEK